MALSLANLCFFSGWNAFYDVVYFQPYFLKDLHPGGDYLALLLDVLLLAAVFWFAALFVRWRRSASLLAGARFLFLLALLVPLHGVYRLMAKRDIVAPLDEFEARLADPPWLILALMVLAVGLYAVRVWHAPIARTLAVVLLLFLPFAVVTFSQALWALATAPSPEQMRGEPLASRLPPPQRTSPRVLWLVFDALDQRLAFAERPAEIDLPELDSLRERSLYATRAYPPAPGTLLSLPAFTTGRLVAQAEPAGPAELAISFASRLETGRWSRSPNIFSRARRRGVNAGLAGWLHPYCRLFEQSLVECFWVPFRYSGQPRGLLERMRDHVLLLLESSSALQQFFWRDPWGLDLYPARSARRAHIHKFRRLRAEARRMAADPGLGLVFVHWPIPHFPGIYDRRSDDLGPPADSRRWYLDNLVLVDRTLGELRRTLEQSGLWEQTTVVVTSDHPWAYADLIDGKTASYVPFLVKLPGQEEGVVYENKFSAVLAADLVFAILRDEIDSPPEAAAWLDRHKERAAIVEFGAE